jgi:uncharacterized protein (TIGR02118 family)
VIIRTGLIKNRDGVREEVFADHWLNVHGPLARQVPGMIAYSQNHIVERYHPIETPELHRVDGLSQLYFPDVSTMAKSMETPEQRACVEDIKGFLSEVTIVIQRRGEVVNLGDNPSRPLKAKLMAVLVGDPQAAEAYASELTAALRDERFGAGRLRINPVVDRNFIVDASVPRGEQVVGAILETWFTGEQSLRRALAGGSFDAAERIMRRAATVRVREHVILAEHASAKNAGLPGVSALSDM